MHASINECINEQSRQAFASIKLKLHIQVWIRDPSPERFLDGKKFKEICVTQANNVSGAPYYCIDCTSYKSNEFYNVRRHHRKHTKEKLFQGKECEKKFAFSTSVVFHWNNMQNKERKRDFSCQVCGLLFSHEGQLKQHDIVHLESCLCAPLHINANIVTWVTALLWPKLLIN